MKKKGILILLMVALLCLGTYGCKAYGAAHGNTMCTVRVVGLRGMNNWFSIQRTMKTVEKQFREEYEGCTLLTLRYDPERTQREVKPSDADEMIVLNGLFYTGNYDVNVLQAWSPNTVYDDYSWVLCRYGNQWVIKSVGWL